MMFPRYGARARKADTPEVRQSGSTVRVRREYEDGTTASVIVRATSAGLVVEVSGRVRVLSAPRRGRADAA